MTIKTDGKPQLLAIFKDAHNRYFTVDGKDFEHVEGYVRISEYVEVTFNKRKLDEQINDEVKELDRQIEEFKEKSIRMLNNLEARKAEVLSLTYQESSDDN